MKTLKEAISYLETGKPKFTKRDIDQLSKIFVLMKDKVKEYIKNQLDG